MSSSLTVAEAAPRTSRRWLTVAGVVLLAITHTVLLITQPAGIAEGLGSGPALAAFAAYLAGGVLILLSVLPELPVRTLALIPVAIALNIVLGTFVAFNLVPLYVDSIGTALIAFLAGRRAGVATGVLGSLVWAFFAPAALPFAAIAGLVGFLAGTAARYGAVRKLWLAPIVGVVAGIVVGLVAAPIAAFVYEGTAGLGTGALVGYFRSMGESLINAVTLQSLTSDPVDKAVVFLVAGLLAYALPPRLTRSFAFVRRYNVLGRRAQQA